MNTCSLLSRLRIACALCLLLPTLAFAQSDTLTISGTFQALETWGDPGLDLYPVITEGQAHTWTLTMQGVTYEQDYSFVDWGGGHYEIQYATRARATSFVLEFFGPNEDLLNSIVSAPLTEVGVELINGSYFDPYSDPVNGNPYLWFFLQAVPANSADAVQFMVSCNNSTESVIYGYPTFESQEIQWSYESIVDNRYGVYGQIDSYGLGVLIESTETSPPPPPVKPSLSIADGSTLEGDQGKTVLSLQLSLSSPASEAVSVQYRTIDGTATSTGSRKSSADFSAATGTVTFQSGQTSQTISVLINGDRKPEANETFTVELSTSASQVTISDATAVATILNDD